MNLGRCPACPEKDRVIAEKDRTIELLTTQLEGREKTMLALVNQAALNARFPKERTPNTVGPTLQRVRSRPADFAAQVYQPDAGKTEAEIAEEFRLKVKGLDVLDMAPEALER